MWASTVWEKDNTSWSPDTPHCPLINYRMYSSLLCLPVVWVSEVRVNVVPIVLDQRVLLSSLSLFLTAPPAPTSSSIRSMLLCRKIYPKPLPSSRAPFSTPGGLIPRPRFINYIKGLKSQPGDQRQRDLSPPFALSRLSASEPAATRSALLPRAGSQEGACACSAAQWGRRGRSQGGRAH